MFTSILNNHQFETYVYVRSLSVFCMSFYPAESFTLGSGNIPSLGEHVHTGESSGDYHIGMLVSAYR